MIDLTNMTSDEQQIVTAAVEMVVGFDPKFEPYGATPASKRYVKKRMGEVFNELTSDLTPAQKDAAWQAWTRIVWEVMTGRAV